MSEERLEYASKMRDVVRAGYEGICARGSARLSHRDNQTAILQLT